MSKISLKPNSAGTANFEIAAPATNVDRTFTLPDEAGTVLTSGGPLNVDDSAPTQSATIDSSGNLLVGTTNNNVAPVSGAGNQGFNYIPSTGQIKVAMNGANSEFNRLASDGDIVRFRKDGSTVGSIGYLGLFQMYGDGASGIRFAANHWRPIDGNGSPSSSGTDNQTDLGRSQNRFDDIYATNGTIQTSDVNEKQDVEELSDAEARVAAKAKTLLRKFRWKSAVEEKGDEARIHFGIIAQDLEQAFIDEGLDAGRYGMFIRGEWWEAEVEKTRTVENEDGTETTENYTATETYASAEEAPEGAVKKERLGVRYHELLAFIIAAI